MSLFSTYTLVTINIWVLRWLEQCCAIKLARRWWMSKKIIFFWRGHFLLFGAQDQRSSNRWIVQASSKIFKVLQESEEFPPFLHVNMFLDLVDGQLQELNDIFDELHTDFICTPSLNPPIDYLLLMTNQICSICIILWNPWKRTWWIFSLNSQTLLVMCTQITYLENWMSLPLCLLNETYVAFKFYCNSFLALYTPWYLKPMPTSICRTTCM